MNSTPPIGLLDDLLDLDRGLADVARDEVGAAGLDEVALR